MDAMRAERRKTGGYSTREAYQVAVDEKVAAHREKVRALLTEEQKAVFDQNQPRQGQGRWARQSGRGGGQGACPRGRWGGRGRR
jgi:Spy/CpxP family protein refolding chaperone